MKASIRPNYKYLTRSKMLMQNNVLDFWIPIQEAQSRRNLAQG